MLRANNT